MLRRDPELTAYVILHELLKESVVFVLHQVIEADAAADEHLFYTVERPKPAQQAQVILVADLHVRAGLGRKALSALAQTELFLLFAGRQPEVRRGAADIAYNALEALVAKEALRLLNDALLAAHGDGAPLMERERAEVARAEAAAVMRN